jgi:hypothetical protein
MGTDTAKGAVYIAVPTGLARGLNIFQKERNSMTVWRSATVVPRHVRAAVSLCMWVFGAVVSGVALADTVRFTTPGAATWTVPDHVYSVDVVATGGGGG